MTKRKFLAKLESALSSLVTEEKNRQLDYYEEMIDDMIEEGMSEEAAVERLGSVQGIAAKILGQASPEMLQKNKSPIKKAIIVLAIILAVCLVAVVLLVGLFSFDHSAAEQKIDEIEDKIEERTELDGNWLSGGDVELEAMGICAVDIVWNSGDVTVSESEGDKIIVNAGDKDALEYQLKSGTLFISNTEEADGSKAKLDVFIPEDLMIKMVSLNVVTSAGNVYVESENFAEMNIVTASGNVSIDENEAMEIEVVSASGNITICTDEDDAFKMDYASESGDVSVSFDKGFKNESTKDSEASYDHSLGNSMYQHINAVTASGDIKLIDD